MPYGIGTLAMIGGGIVGAAGLIPMAIGFGTAGIAAGSIAAGIQSSIGAVTAGSTFATMTSFGMTGVFSSLATIGSSIFAVGGISNLYNYFKRKK